MRRIVTGHNDNGKSVIKIDGPPARSIGEVIGVYSRYGMKMEQLLIQKVARIELIAI